MASDPRAIVVVSGMAFEAAIAQAPAIRTVYGLDSSALTQNIERAIQEGAAGLLSFGVSAGLSPSLSSGTIAIAQHVKWRQQVFTADAAWAKALGGQFPQAMLADIAGVDSPLTSAQEKSALHTATNAASADMESQHVASLAQRHNLPFAALRVVLDDASCALPQAALAATTARGTIDYGKLMISLLANPLQLGALIRLASAHARAKKVLLRCGDLKGSLFGFHLRHLR